MIPMLIHQGDEHSERSSHACAADCAHLNFEHGHLTCHELQRNPSDKSCAERALLNFVLFISNTSLYVYILSYL